MRGNHVEHHRHHHTFDPQAHPILAALAAHWREYLIEGLFLGLFMVSACVFVVLFEHPDSPVHHAMADQDFLRRMLIGIAMGLTAIALIASPWGHKSGAHMNPSVTLSMLYLGKISAWDAMFYVPAQFVGGALGVGLSQLMLGARIWHKTVDYAVTVPGSLGEIGAFVCEFGISCLLLTIVLKVAHTRYAAYTPYVAGTLVATYITFEAPYSGMSMNPARTVASAVWANEWPAMWVYFLAPVLGMMTGALLHKKVFRTL